MKISRLAKMGFAGLLVGRTNYGLHLWLCLFGMNGEISITKVLWKYLRIQEFDQHFVEQVKVMLDFPSGIRYTFLMIIDSILIVLFAYLFADEIHGMLNYFWLCFFFLQMFTFCVFLGLDIQSGTLWVHN